jgi:phosphate transport system substrate-binding protein
MAFTGAIAFMLTIFKTNAIDEKRVGSLIISNKKNMKIYFLKILIPFLLLTIVFSCGDNKDKNGIKLDTQTQGHIKLMVDEGYKPIIESSLDVFDSIYRQASFDAKYVAEGVAVKALIDDSLDVIIITRKLSQEEESYLKEKTGLAPRVTPIAHDAIAFILHPSNNDTVFTKAQVQDILTGKTTQWKQINPKSPLSAINLVFDNVQSGTVRYCKDSILMGTDIYKGANALQTNQDVITYVAKNKNAIGIIAANWISDTDSKGVQGFLKEIALADIAEKEGEEGYGPFQAYLATRQYPYKRTVYLINGQNRPGLGMGLASYLASDPGQRIVLKSGMLPANTPIRLLKTRKEKI